jgi:hypothetical protein
MNTEQLSEHKKSIIGKRRSNNIFGSISDYVINSFLNLGGECAFYNANDFPHIIGKTERFLYVANKIEKDSYRKMDFSKEIYDQKLVDFAEKIGAVPLFAVSKNYSDKCVYYNKKGQKLNNIN